MGIRLDWEIEAEQELTNGGSEDPEARRKRRRAQRRFFIFFMVVVLLIGGLIGAAALRLHYVDWQIEQTLRDTVSAEIAALRIGDENAFMSMQRSATDTWLNAQRDEFTAYQTLKSQPNTAFTGDIESVTIDSNRARVEVREIIGGVAYERLWFYWNYQDGWRHVPQDTTFWGDSRTLTSDHVVVNYDDADSAAAQQVRATVESWLQTACGLLACDAIPHVTVNIVPDTGVQPGSVEPWTLQIPSPLLDRMRADAPFNPAVQLVLANALAEQLFNVASHNMSVTYPADAYYLRQAVISWLAGRLSGAQTNAFLIGSLASNYGESAVGRLVAVLQPDLSITVFASLANVPTAADVDVDWRDYLTWRLALEGELIARHAQDAFMSLYATHDSAVRDLAAARYINATASDGWVVVNTSRDSAPDGTPVLQADVQVGSSIQTVLFQLVDGVWKRAN